MQQRHPIDDIIQHDEPEFLAIGSRPSLKVMELRSPATTPYPEDKGAAADTMMETGSKIAIVDNIGVTTVDTVVAQHLMKTVTAARFLC